MGPAEQRARELRARHGLGLAVADYDLALIVESLGLEVVTWPFDGRTTEVLAAGCIGLRPDLGRPERRWLIAHAVGHHLLHRGNHLTATDCVWIGHQERQAHLFAGWLHLAETWAQMPAWELAEYHSLPEERVRWWLEEMRASTMTA